MNKISKETFKAGDFIFFEGDIETHFFIIESGSVSIFVKDKTGKKIEVARLSDGETFGEFALISQGARTASAQALTDVKVMKVSAEGYETMLNDLPLWASSMLRSFSKRLKQMNSNLKDLKSQ
ncbi:Crp/Fnr family transcriptional regulator [Pseudobdellovibrio exovorus]|uniref:Hyperpolarization-activated, cyclic nucleotide-gated K n=1 Tax=Pseudobdellovibrio exovorus JSS TaxID=1184267 RepID=M4V9G4_9BACT|nr:cyclic nucleotide-binding domain-containing protein [Pseudobdellovibrio exovorus]AGH96022.1 hyperpolarization-activated, cyclic nucleotide-gated K+ [Pseudobdellovibrio exovorus JSS]